MNTVKTLPSGFLLITVLLACVAVVPSMGAVVIQGAPGQDVSLTPSDGFVMPAFCSPVQGGSDVPCDLFAQNALAGTRAQGNFTPGLPERSGRMPEVWMIECPPEMPCPEDFTMFCAGPLSAARSIDSENGFTSPLQLAHTGSPVKSASSTETGSGQTAQPVGQQSLQFAGVSGNAFTFSEAQSAGSATDGFAYPGYRGSGARATVSSVSFPHWCRF